MKKRERNGKATTRNKKKMVKKEAEKEKEEVGKVAEGEDKRHDVAVAEAVEVVVVDWDEWPEGEGLWTSVVDEQMSWGSLWCPFWGIDLKNEDCIHEMYDDVWDGGDIWNLKAINEVTN